ncbi:mechanosensitive ion channel domain-containing protein [Mycobacterium simiae]|uniref:mechanosensitive ion channel domain-containing protein n=1 Tax=Mycobacterium simiae TaxID=1784 RepID=UPI001CB7447B
MTAGLAFALQRVITAAAGYFVIPRGDTFNIGDRSTMGGVRGDVIGLGFIKTTITKTAGTAGRGAAAVGDEPSLHGTRGDRD